jgi:hypothetical protein
MAIKSRSSALTNDRSGSKSAMPFRQLSRSTGQSFSAFALRRRSIACITYIPVPLQWVRALVIAKNLQVR